MNRIKCINKKIRVLILQVLIVVLSLFIVGCTTSEPVETKIITVEYDGLLYYGQTGNITVISEYDDDEIVLENLNKNIIELEEIDMNNYTTKGIGVGTAQIAIYSSYLDEEMIIEITVESVEGYEAPIQSVELSLVEEGPYYINQKYNLEVEFYPEIFKDTYRFITSSDYELNEEDMTIVFKRSGKLDVAIFAETKSKRFNLLVDVKANPNQESYDILFIGNSLTYVHDIPSIIQNMITSDGGYMVYSQDTPGGSYLKDHESMFNQYISKYHYSHVILQGQSYEPIDKKEEFLETMEKFGKKSKRNWSTSYRI